MIFFSKNGRWKVIWDCREQTYNVYKNEENGQKLIGPKYKFSDIQSYLN